MDIFRHKASFRNTLADKPEPIGLPGDLHISITLRFLPLS
jgi:hypothetical protein